MDYKGIIYFNIKLYANKTVQLAEELYDIFK